MEDCLIIIDISIHAPREGGDVIRWKKSTLGILQISIHAPREGGDHGLVHKLRLFAISIHAPREGGDPAPHPA